MIRDSNIPWVFSLKGRQSISFKITCAPSENSWHPTHPRSLIKVFAGHFVGSKGSQNYFVGSKGSQSYFVGSKGSQSYFVSSKGSQSYFVGSKGSKGSRSFATHAQSALRNADAQADLSLPWAHMQSYKILCTGFYILLAVCLKVC